MTLFHLVILAVIQGVTEFLPISSSGHLILLPGLSGMTDQGQAIDVAVHVGTLVAVVIYFRSEVMMAARGSVGLLQGRTDTADARLAYSLLVATVPVVVAGYILHATGLDAMLRSVAVIGWAMLVFGVVLYWADQRGAETRQIEDFRLKHAIILGLWQAIALIPGTSRSGITITGGRLLGYGRDAAARISMLMSIPTILASGVILGADVAAEGNFHLAREAAIAAAFSCVAAFAALWLMMRLLKSISFTPYVIYRVILGVILLWVAYS